MTLNEQINSDLVNAMKAKDSFKLGVIRMVKGAIQLEKINLKRDLNDEEIIAILAKQIKMRKDSIAEFEKGNRADLIKQYNDEIEILNTYMPAQLSKDEIKAILDAAFEKIQPTSSKDMGAIMREVSPKLKGRCDMGEVNSLIKDRLSQL